MSSTKLIARSLHASSFSEIISSGRYQWLSIAQTEPQGNGGLGMDRVMSLDLAFFARLTVRRIVLDVSTDFEIVSGG